MERLIEKELKQWKEKKDRKVLLLRGARQVGKTYSIRKLSKSFKKFLEINFEAKQCTVHDFMTFIMA